VKESFLNSSITLHINVAKARGPLYSVTGIGARMYW